LELADEMAHPSLAPSIGRDFDSFLFASIGPDRHGQALSVISALARSGLDPWEEAINLSRMPQVGATQRLSRLIASLPGLPAPIRPLEAVVGDLIGRLPTNRSLVPPLPEKIILAVGRPDARLGVGLGAIVVLTAIGFLLASRSTPDTAGSAHSQAQTLHAPSAEITPRPAGSDGVNPR
jgi:hypothetical protein